MKKFILELGVVPSVGDGIVLHCDNNGAIAKSKEPRSQQRCKHVLRKYFIMLDRIVKYVI